MKTGPSLAGMCRPNRVTLSTAWESPHTSLQALPPASESCCRRCRSDPQSSRPAEPRDQSRRSTGPAGMTAQQTQPRRLSLRCTVPHLQVSARSHLHRTTNHWGKDRHPRLQQMEWPSPHRRCTKSPLNRHPMAPSARRCRSTCLLRTRRTDRCAQDPARSSSGPWGRALVSMHPRDSRNPLDRRRPPTNQSTDNRSLHHKASTTRHLARLRTCRACPSDSSAAHWIRADRTCQANTA